MVFLTAKKQCSFTVCFQDSKIEKIANFLLNSSLKIENCKINRENG